MLTEQAIVQGAEPCSGVSMHAISHRERLSEGRSRRMTSDAGADPFCNRFGLFLAPLDSLEVSKTPLIRTPSGKDPLSVGYPEIEGEVSVQCRQ